MAKSTSGMEIEDARTTRCLRVAVGHGNRTGLLQRQYVTDIRRFHQSVNERQLGGSGIAKDVARPFASQYFKEHGSTAPLPKLVQLCDRRVDGPPREGRLTRAHIQRQMCRSLLRGLVGHDRLMISPSFNADVGRQRLAVIAQDALSPVPVRTVHCPGR
jgi:hypothetical protein